jgi:hypothetical protein
MTTTSYGDKLTHLFWEKDQVFSFNSTTVHLFFYLLKVNKAGNWSEEFNHPDKRTLAALGCGRATLIKSKQTLIDAELLEYTAGGAHYGAQTKYSLITPYMKVMEVKKAVSTYVQPSGKVIVSKNLGATNEAPKDDLGVINEAPKSTPKAIKHIINVNLGATNETPNSIPKPKKRSEKAGLGVTNRTPNLTSLNIEYKQLNINNNNIILNIEEILAFDFKDQKKRNLEGFIRNLKELGANDDDLICLLKVSEFGIIGHPVWKYISNAKSSNGMIKQPIAYIKSRVLPVASGESYTQLSSIERR